MTTSLCDAAAPERPNRRTWLTVVGFLAIVLLGASFVVLNRAEVPNAVSAARDAHPGFGALAGTFGVLYLVTYAGLVWSCMRATGFRMDFRRAALVGTAGHFFNMAIVNSGGLGALPVALAEARRTGQPGGRAVAGYILVAQVGHLAFAVALGAALVAAVISGQLTGLELVAAAIFAGYTLAVVAGLAATAFSERLFLAVHGLPRRVASRLRRFFRRPGANSAADDDEAARLYTVVRELLHSPRKLIAPAGFGVAIELIGIGMLWACLAAFGVHTSIEVPLVAYAAGVLFSTVGFLPAGLGFAEAGLGIALSRAGVDGPRVALVVVTFRLLETWLPFGAGVVALQFVGRGRQLVSSNG